MAIIRRRNPALAQSVEQADEEWKPRQTRPTAARQLLQSTPHGDIAVAFTLSALADRYR